MRLRRSHVGRNPGQLTRTIGFASVVAIALSSYGCTQQSTQTSSSTPTIGPIVVDVLGKNFGWTFCLTYDTTTGSRCVQAGRSLHLPADVPVHFRVTSDDYVYVLNLPADTNTQIAVPDMIHEVDAVFIDEGTHELMSDPLCGLSFLHDDVMGEITVDSPTRFGAWLAAQELVDDAT